MSSFKRIFLLILLIISVVAVSVCSYVFLPEKYEKFSGDIKKEPAMTSMLKGAAAGVYPWSAVQEQEESAPKTQEQQSANSKTVEASDSEETEQTDAQTPSEPKSFTQVTDDYFNDAVFIGDSRVLGLSMYCEPIYSRAKFFAKKSLTIYDIRDKSWVETEDGEKITVFDALSQISFSKVYMMVGINELGTGDNDSYANAYKNVIDRILEIQPDAIIYINSIMHVSKEKSDKDPIFNNGSINVRNMAVVPYADGQHVFFLNINDAVDDGEGNLDSSLTGDGIHLKGSCYEPWHQYLLYNAIVN